MYDDHKNFINALASRIAITSFYDAAIMFATSSFISVVLYKYILYFFRVTGTHYIERADTAIAKTMEFIVIHFLLLVITLGLFHGLTSSLILILQILIFINFVIDLAITSVALPAIGPNSAFMEHGISFETYVLLLKTCIFIAYPLHHGYGLLYYVIAMSFIGYLGYRFIPFGRATQRFRDERIASK